MNEPAFPRDHAHDGHNGMSLRDYFAGQALVGCFNFWVQVNARTTIGDPDPKAITQLAYEYADEMLKARAAPGVTPSDGGQP